MKSIQASKIRIIINLLAKNFSKSQSNLIISKYCKRDKDQAIQDELPRLPKIFLLLILKTPKGYLTLRL